MASLTTHPDAGSEEMSATGPSLLGAVTLSNALLYVVLTGVLVLLIQRAPMLYRMIFFPKPFKGVPMNVKPQLFLGHASIFGKEQISGTKKLCYDQADPKTGLASCYMVSSPILSVLRAEDVKTVLESSTYRDTISLLQRHTDMFLGKNAIVTVQKEQWKSRRRTIARSFAHSVLKNIVHHFSAVSGTLSQTLADNNDDVPATTTARSRTVHVTPLMKKITLDAFGLAALQYEFGCCRSTSMDPVAEAFEYIQEEYAIRSFEEPLNPLLWYYNLPTERNKKWHAANNIVTDLLKDIVDKTRKDMLATPVEGQAKRPPSVVSALLQAQMSGEKLTDDDIVNDIKAFFFAGYDTTAITLTYAVYLLSQSPEWEMKVLNEVREVLEVNPHAPNLSDRLKGATFEDAGRMKFTEAVVKEALRLYPPGVMTARTMTKDVNIAGREVPAGTAVFVPIWWIQRSPLNWNDPDVFRPERFVVDDDTATATAAGQRRRPTNSEGAHPYAWVPFSGGQRNCVGQRFAMLEAVVALGALIYHLRFEYAKDPAEDPVRSATKGVVQEPLGGMPMRVYPREHV